MLWESALSDYKTYLRLERGLSENSISSYGYDIERFIRYIKKENEKITPLNCSKDHVQAFVYSIAKTVNPRSQARQISGLKSFFNFIIFEGYREDSPLDLIDSPKIGRKLPEVLQLNEIEKIIASIDLSNPLGHRNAAILETLYGS